MPQFRNKLVSKRVKALAAKHGLPYHLYDYKTIVLKTLRNLGAVSAKLEDKFNESTQEHEVPEREIRPLLSQIGNQPKKMKKGFFAGDLLLDEKNESKEL